MTPARPALGALVALGEYLDRKYPPTPLAALDAFRALIEADGHPALDTITALTASSYGPTVTAHIGEHLAFLRWAEHLGLAFQRAYQRDGFVLSARGPVRADNFQLQVHLICSPDGIPS